MKRYLAIILLALLLCNTADGGFGGFLQANTAVDLMVGPFVDDTDGKTAETGLTITQAEVRLSKNGGNMAQKNEATSLTHDELGNYVCKLDTTDTNTEGILTIMVHESGALPIKMDYMVLAQAAYISHITAKDTGYMGVDVEEVDGTDQTGNDNGADINTIVTAVGNIETDTAAYDTDAEYATAIWNALTNAYGGAGTYGQVAEDVLVDTSTTLDNFVDDLESGVDVIKILGTAVTETNAGDIAESFTFFFDVDPVTTKTVDDVGGAAGLEVDVTKIHGTAITETSSGNIAGNFSTFWDNADAATANVVDNVGGASGGGSILAVGAGNLGDYKEDATVYFIWRTIDRSGAADTPSTVGTVAVYKNNGTGQVTTPTGISDTRSFDSGDTTAGVHLVIIDTSANSFYTVGQDYSVVLYGAVIDTKTVTSVIATFSIEKRWTEEFWEYEG